MKKARITYKEEVRSNEEPKNPFAHLSPEIRALNIQTANAAALSQITSRPKFMQKMNVDATSSSKGKQDNDKDNQ